MSEASNIKLSFWRPFVPDTALMDLSLEKDSVRLHAAAVASGMHKEIYGWRMQDDALGGIAKVEERERLRASLFDELAVNVPPSERSLEKLRIFINEAEKILTDGAASWSDSQSQSVEEDETMRINALLALVCHLRWLVDVFDEKPDVSVTVR